MFQRISHLEIIHPFLSSFERASDFSQRSRSIGYRTSENEGNQLRNTDAAKAQPNFSPVLCTPIRPGGQVQVLAFESVGLRCAAISMSAWSLEKDEPSKGRRDQPRLIHAGESDRIGLAVFARCAYSALTTLRLAPRYLILTCSSLDSELPGRCREQDEEEEGEGEGERKKEREREKEDGSHPLQPWSV